MAGGAGAEAKAGAKTGTGAFKGAIASRRVVQYALAQSRLRLSPSAEPPLPQPHLYCCSLARIPPPPPLAPAIRAAMNAGQQTAAGKHRNSKSSSEGVIDLA